jgi:hypothetical protein
MALAPLTVVSNELEAEMLCGELRANGIACEYRSAGMLADQFGSAVAGVVLGQAAQTEVFVDEARLEEARKFLPDVST